MKTSTKNYFENLFRKIKVNDKGIARGMIALEKELKSLIVSVEIISLSSVRLAAFGIWST